MRHILTSIGALTAALALSACDGDRNVRISSSSNDESGVLKVLDALQCPETQGVLTRKGSAQAEGTICTYSGPRGSEVTLHLVSLDGGSADSVLDSFEATLKRDLPDAARRMKPPEPPAPPAAPDAPETAAAGERTTVEMPGLTVRSEGDNSTVRLPGLRVESEGNRSSVRIGGIHIESDESGDSVNIASNDERVSIQAHDDAAEIRTRAPGGAVRGTYILTDDSPSDAGWRLVGYEARGPAGGPLVVATVRSKDRDKGSVFEDALDLVSLNVGE